MPAFLIPIIEVLTAALSRLVASRLGQWLLTGALFLGIQWVSKKVAVDVLIPQIASHVAGMGALTVAWLAYLNVDRAITIILSAYASAAGTRMVMQRVGK